MSLRDKIYNWLKKQPGHWVSSVSIDKVVAKNTKHSGSYASRQCRLLAEEKLIERQERLIGGKRLAFYRYNPPTDPVQVSRRMIEWFESL